MSELYMMATISDRNQARRFLAFYKEHQVSLTLVNHGFGYPGFLWPGSGRKSHNFFFRHGHRMETD